MLAIEFGESAEMGKTPFEGDLSDGFPAFLIDQIAMDPLQANGLDIGARGHIEKTLESGLQAADTRTALRGDVEDRQGHVDIAANIVQRAPHVLRQGRRHRTSETIREIMLEPLQYDMPNGLLKIGGSQRKSQEAIGSGYGLGHDRCDLAENPQSRGTGRKNRRKNQIVDRGLQQPRQQAHEGRFIQHKNAVQHFVPMDDLFQSHQVENGAVQERRRYFGI